MSYSAIAQAAQDQHLRLRIAACIAQERPTDKLHPIAHADAIQWQVSASPGLAEAYSYAVETNLPDPGNDSSVITDAMLLAAVVELLGNEEQ